MLRVDVDRLLDLDAAGDVCDIGPREPSDEYHGMLETLQELGGIVSDADEHISIYPLSNSEDAPMIVVRTGPLLLLGGELKTYRDKPSEDDPAPLSVLAQRAVDEANGLLATLAQYVSERGGQ